MPGPISDSYDPEFGTGDNAAAVREAVQKTRKKFDKALGPALHNIVEVANGPAGRVFSLKLSKRELRIIRFCLNRSLESI
jgi:hypothetical protein